MRSASSTRCPSTSPLANLSRWRYRYSVPSVAVRTIRFPSAASAIRRTVPASDAITGVSAAACTSMPGGIGTIVASCAATESARPDPPPDAPPLDEPEDDEPDDDPEAAEPPPVVVVVVVVVALGDAPDPSDGVVVVGSAAPDESA